RRRGAGRPPRRRRRRDQRQRPARAALARGGVAERPARPRRHRPGGAGGPLGADQPARHLRAGPGRGVGAGGGRRMRSWRMVLQVALWELRRFYKLRDQLLSLALAVLGGAFGFGVQYLVGKAAGPVTVAVIGGDRLPPPALPPGSRITLEAHAAAEEPALRDAVGARALDGLLVIGGPDRAELFVAREPVWKDELHAALSGSRRLAK